jgi:hypothetical protein
MSQPLLYIDTSEVHEGTLEELKGAVDELVEFIEANVPRVLAYSVYFTDDGRQMTVVHLHVDSGSLESHLEVGGPVFRKFSELLTLSSIHVYGKVSAKVLKQLHEKARSLGTGEVVVHDLHAGFSRLDSR